VLALNTSITASIKKATDEADITALKNLQTLIAPLTMETTTTTKEFSITEDFTTDISAT